MRRFILALTVGAIVLSAAACSTAGSSPSGGSGGTIEGITWTLTSYDVGGTSTKVPPDVFVDARFAGGTVVGSGGCNVYNGPAVVTGSAIKIGPLAGTLIACQGPAADVEKAYLDLLPKAVTFTATADALTMFDAAGKATLVYAAGAANPLIGDWNVTGYNNGKGAVTSPTAGSTLTATFTADSVSGSSGCNTYNGGYKLDGLNVTIGPLASTMKACEQPLMDQEAAFLKALQTPGTVEQTGANVGIRDSAGATQVTFGPK
jgi:heat shock protein HslJ